MVFCRFCGEEIPEDAFICPNCNISVNETGIPKDNVFICPVCGRENPPEERKCNYCCSLF